MILILSSDWSQVRSSPQPQNCPAPLRGRLDRTKSSIETTSSQYISILEDVSDNSEEDEVIKRVNMRVARSFQADGDTDGYRIITKPDIELFQEDGATDELMNYCDAGNSARTNCDTERSTIPRRSDSSDTSTRSVRPTKSILKVATPSTPEGMAASPSEIPSAGVWRPGVQGDRRPGVQGDSAGVWRGRCVMRERRLSQVEYVKKMKIVSSIDTVEDPEKTEACMDQINEVSNFDINVNIGAEDNSDNDDIPKNIVAEDNSDYDDVPEIIVVEDNSDDDDDVIPENIVAEDNSDDDVIPEIILTEDNFEDDDDVIPENIVAEDNSDGRMPPAPAEDKQTDAECTGSTEEEGRLCRDEIYPEETPEATAHQMLDAPDSPPTASDLQRDSSADAGNCLETTRVNTVNADSEVNHTTKVDLLMQNE